MKPLSWKLALLLGSLGAAGTVLATPTADEAAQLGKTLTPLGAIKSGNADGTIPEWTGGYCDKPANYKPGRGAAGGAPYVDPFAADRPLYKITAADVAKYADKLDDGTKEMFKRHPQTYRVDVYPTRRSACFPDWVYQNTIKNVMKPRIVAQDVTPALEGAHAQIPFPIPKTGVEAMWNALVKYETPYSRYDLAQSMIDTSGKRVLTGVNTVDNEKPYWDNSFTGLPVERPYWSILSQTSFPPSQVGTMQMRLQFLRPDMKGAPAYSYTPGQRRVRLAPEFSYDGVSSASGGLLLYDEINGFDGKMDRFDFRLVGRRELLIPYNAYKIWTDDADAIAGPKHVNPDYLRWELHRVWVVEGKLKDGERHVESKKMFYIDEDSWSVVVYNGWDQNGKLYHQGYLPPIQLNDRPEFANRPYILYDLPKSAYMFMNRPSGIDKLANKTLDGVYVMPTYKKNFFTPEAMAGLGLR